MMILIINDDINKYQWKPAQAEQVRFMSYNMNTNYICHTVYSFCLLCYSIKKNEQMSK